MLKSLVLRPNRSLRSKSRPNSSLSAIDEASRPPLPRPCARQPHWGASVAARSWSCGPLASCLVPGSRSRPRYGFGAFSRSCLSLPTSSGAQGGQPARRGILGVTLLRHSAPSHCIPDDAAGTSGPGHTEPARGAVALSPQPRDTDGMGWAQTRTGWAGLRPGRGRDGRSGRDRAADGVPADPRADRRTRANTGPHGALRGRTGAKSGRKGPGG
jgi:hypothetical protein